MYKRFVSRFKSRTGLAPSFRSLALITSAITLTLALTVLNSRADKVINLDKFYLRLYDHLSATETLCVQDLVDQYLSDQNIFAYIAPPAADFTLFQPGATIYIPEKNAFSREFLQNLISSEESGKFNSIIWIYEDAKSPGRDLVIENDYGIELLRIARQEGYSSDWVVRKIYPDYELYPSYFQEYLYSIFDPSRIFMRYTVIVGEVDLAGYVEEKVARMELARLESSMMTRIPATQAVTNLMFTAVKPQTNNTVKLIIAWPDNGLATNKLEIFTCDNLSTGAWSFAETVTIDLSTNRHEWIDYDGHTNRTSRFYDCFTLEDSDGDNITDGWERLIYKTNIYTNDSDGDTVSDYDEVFSYCYTNVTYNTVTQGTDPNNADSDGDELSDGEELYYGTDPWRGDTDGDEINDASEATQYYLMAWGDEEHKSYFRTLPASAVALSSYHVWGDRAVCLLENGGAVELRDSGDLLDSPGFATNFVSTSVGQSHRCASTEIGGLVFWWCNADTPFLHENGEASVQQVACGRGHTAVLLANKTVRSYYHYGYGYSGETNQPPQMTNAIAVATGNKHTLALLDDGKVLAWGANNRGQTTVPENVTNAIAVAAGHTSSAAILSNGSVSIWGYTGEGLFNAVHATNAIALACGQYNCIIRRKNNSVFAWGQGCGDTKMTNLVFETTVKEIRAGGEGMAVILENGKTTMINVRQPSYLRTMDCHPLGRSNAVAIVSTNPLNPDTDDDGLPDPWEIYYGFNPLVWNDSSIDSDGDGLTDKQEANVYTVIRTASLLTMGISTMAAMSFAPDLWMGWTLSGLNPYLSDSDWDGTLDTHDIDPLDYLSRDVANNNTTVLMTLTIGDGSGSHSEKYALNVGPYRVHMPHVNQSSYMFSASFRVPCSMNYSGAVTSLYDDDPDGDYDAYVTGNGLAITPSGVLGKYGYTGFNSGSKPFTLTTPASTPSNKAADSASKDPANAEKADPVNAISGNVTIARTDAAINCPGLPLVFGRYYNSSTLFGGGALGPGWAHSYEIRLGNDETNTLYKASSGTIRRLHLPDGRTYAFSKTNGVYTAADDMELTLASCGADQWSVSRPGGFEWIFDNQGQIVSMSDGQGNALALAYVLNTDTGKQYLSEIEHSNGRSIHLSYTNDLQRSVFLQGFYSDDPDWVVTYDYDSSGRLAHATRLTYSEGVFPEGYLYENIGFCLTQRVNSAGTTFNYTYTDIERNGVKQRFGSSTWLDDNAYRTDFNYHVNNVSNNTRIVAHRSIAEIISSLLTWDEEIWQVASEINEEDGSGYELSYDDDQNLIRTAIFHHSITSSVIRAYDSRHNILREAAALGATPDYSTNATHYQWHPALSLPLSISDSESITNSFVWSTSGLLLKAYDALSTNTFGYTANGQIASLTNANGNVTDFSYDALGHPYLTTPPAGPSYRTLYDTNGYLTNSALPEIGGGWRTTAYANDTFGRIQSVTYPDGLSEQIHRNGAGVATSTVDRAGNRIAYTYAAGNKLTSVTNWLDASTPVGISFNYDWQMNNLTVINPMGDAVETYTLDAQERVESVTNLEGQRLDVTYLVGGLVSSIDRFDGVLISNIFDSAGNVTETLHDGVSIEQASYRRNGQLRSISNVVAEMGWSYDISGSATNVQSSVGSLQSSVSYAFDPMGNTTNVELRINNGELRIGYEYDEAERLSVIAPNPSNSLQLPGPFTLSYNDYNGLLNTLSNDNIKADYTFDVLDAVTNTVYRDGSGNAIASFDYRCDVLGLITQKVTVIDGTAVTNSYTFDNIGRLTSEQVNSETAVSYTYDLAGNRLSAGASNFTYTHNKLDGAYHDSAGNITNMVRNGVTLDLVWNTQGQLVEVKTNGVFAEGYTWGPLGNRLSTSNANGVVFHAYDGDQCVADYSASGDLIASYTWASGIDNLLAVTVYEETATNTYYTVKDHLNSVHALIGDCGNSVLTVSYNAWGTPDRSLFTIGSSQFRLRYLFQGREYSQTTGLYNFRARWYDSHTGRWLSKDPIGLEGGLNLYVFCGNNPVNFVDPWGLCEELPFGVQQDMVGIQDMSGVYISEIALAVLKWGRLAGWVGNKIDDLYRGLSRYGDDVARSVTKTTQGMTKSSRTRFKRTINNLSKSDMNPGLSQQKLDQLRRISSKADAKIRVDLEGVRGTGVKPHAHVEGMGSKIESRHIWLQEGVQ